MNTQRDRTAHPPAPALVVHLPDDRVLRFSTQFHVGRDAECEAQIQDISVSRRHAVVFFADGEWSIRDLHSSNGLFVDRQRVDTAPIGSGVIVRLGGDGPSITIVPENATLGRPAAPEPPAREQAADSVLPEDYAQRYFGPAGDAPMGKRTIMIREAYQQVQQKQQRKYRRAIAIVTVIAIVAAGYAYYERWQRQRLEDQAEEFFYAMKVADVAIADLERTMSDTGNEQQKTALAAYLEQRRRLENNYDQRLQDLYDRHADPKERLILQVTRTFGECELGAPPEYIREVNRYIRLWQSTGRFAAAVKRAQSLGYTERIAAEFMRRNLPPQFFYLAMQESSFDPYASGKPTRWGIAKGMWQFIPETGSRYGLKIGPLAQLQKPDQADERFNWQKATVAAASYVKDIYATDAQASGLLVIASYNWGERRVIDLLRKMPANPRERNWWKLVETNRERVPPETYDYVFNIVAAAVIGENPRLFGYSFDSPLAFPARSGNASN
jgi:membrane-bound lytic murein transglycosylase D